MVYKLFTFYSSKWAFTQNGNINYIDSQRPIKYLIIVILSDSISSEGHFSVWSGI